MAQINTNEIEITTNLELFNDTISAKYWERKILGYCTEGLVVSKRKESKFLKDYIIIARLIEWKDVKSINITIKYAWWQFIGGIIGICLMIWGVYQCFFGDSPPLTETQLEIAFCITSFTMIYILALRRVKIICGTINGLYDYYSKPFDGNIKQLIKPLLGHCAKNEIIIKSDLNK